MDKNSKLLKGVIENLEKNTKETCCPYCKKPYLKGSGEIIIPGTKEVKIIYTKSPDCNCIFIKKQAIKLKNHFDKQIVEGEIPEKYIKYSHLLDNDYPQIIEDIKKSLYGVILLGNSGVGKTGLAMYYLFDRINKFETVFYLNMSNFIDRILDENDFFKTILKAKTLVLDDFDLINFSVSHDKKEWLQTKIHTLINTRMDNLKKTIIIMNNYNAQIINKVFGDRGKDRLGTYEKIRIDGTSRRKKNEF
jgi:DNA replication protein DnaC